MVWNALPDDLRAQQDYESFRQGLKTWGPIYKISYDLSYDYRKFIVRSTYDSDLKRAEISLRNIVS